MLIEPTRSAPYQQSRKNSDNYYPLEKSRLSASFNDSLLSSHVSNGVGTRKRCHVKNGDVEKLGLQMDNGAHEYLHCNGNSNQASNEKYSAFSTTQFQCKNEGLKISIKQRPSNSNVQSSKSYVDAIARVLFPLCYLSFNIAYWLIYATHRHDYSPMAG